MEFVDMHGHFAWGIDDGIVDEAMADAALKQAQSQGYQTIVCTPHVIPGKHKEEDIWRFQARIEAFKEKAKAYDIDVYMGCELFLNDLYYESAKNNLVIPINHTKYLLCEFDVRKDVNDDPETFINRLYELKTMGYQVVLAHVERYFKTDLDVDLIDEALEMGIIMQVNTSSLLHPDRTSGRHALELLRTNRVHMIASDTHRASGTRCPNMKDCYEMLKDTYDEEDLKLLFHDNPLALINDQPIQSTRFVRKGLFKKKWIRG